MPMTVSAEPSTVVPTLLPRGEEACRWVQWLTAVVAAVLAGSNLLAWVHGSVPTIAFLPGLMVMRVNNALCILAAALSLACWIGTPGPGRRWLAILLAVVPLVIGGLTAIQDLADVDLGIDQILSPGTIPGDLGVAAVRHAGRMSLNASLSNMLLGFALLLLDWAISWKRRTFWPASVFALLAAMPASLGLVGYLLGIDSFTGFLRSTNILLHTAIALFGLAVGILAARPGRPPVSLILSPRADGTLLRWTLPGASVLLLTLGWTIGRGRVAGFIVPGEGAAVMLYGGLILLFGLLFVVSQAVRRQESHALAATAALLRGEERSRAIVDTSLDAVILIDMAGLVVDWNPAAERIFGWPRAEIVGRSLAECIIPVEFRAAHARGLSRLQETGQGAVFGKRLELSALRRSGEQFPVELSINPLPGTEGDIFVGFIRDITSRQAAEEKLRTAKETAESASRAKDHFVAALSHELRTPLTPVLLSAAALRADGRLPTDVREQMAMMEQNIALEARLIDDLLDLTRITRGKFLLRLESCDTHSLLSHAVEIVREDARQKNIELDLHLGAKCSGVIGDPARLQQVFWNLLKNAVKFTSPGGRVVIRTEHDAAADLLRLEIQDTGLGFKPEAAERIFQPFEQAGREGNQSQGGLGLGLAIARSIVDLHGGAIRASSPGVEKGATFTVEFPNPIIAPQGMLMADAVERPDQCAAGFHRILLVEDHEPTLKVLTRLLTKAGHQIIPVKSVAEARAAAKANRFDVLVSDLGLPDGTGVELMIALSEEHPGLPAIALSGYGMEEDLRRTRAAGFAAHLVKPIDFDHLLSALQRLEMPS